MGATETPTDATWRGKVGKLDEAETAAFLAGGLLARLACLDAEGWPYVVPTWYQFADGGFWIIPRQRSAWAAHLERDGRVSLAIDEPGAPYRKVLVKGVAELVERPNVGGRWVAIANEMAIRYLGEHGPDYLVPTLNEPRWLFFARPVTMTTWQSVDWAKKYKTAGDGENETCSHRAAPRGPAINHRAQATKDPEGP